MRMHMNKKVNVAIIDYGMGNLFSIKHACDTVGFSSKITSDKHEIQKNDIVILPGVGAFGDAMQILKNLDLISSIKDFASSGRPLLGICLGQQLLMSESYEFGIHKGIDLISGTVEFLGTPMTGDKFLKVPHVGWNRIFSENVNQENQNFGLEPPALWVNSPLSTMRNGEYMYFVHSYFINPDDDAVALSYTYYGSKKFISGVKKGNIFAFQFHPERSGPAGLNIYKNLINFI